MPGSDEVNPAGSGLKLTHDDFLQFPDDGQRHESIDGEHLVTPSPNLKHPNVLEYWVVDPDIEVIRVYRRNGERFARPTELSREAGDVLTTPLLPGLDIPLAHVFGD